MIERLFVLALIFFSSCSSPSTRWNLSNVSLGKENSSRLIHKIENHYTGIRLELLRISEEVHGYLCVSSSKIKDDSIVIEIDIEGQPFEGKAFSYQGGQRFRLNDDTTELIIRALSEDKDVTLQFDRYQEVIRSDQFLEKYHQWIKDPINWKSFIKKIF